MKLGCVPTLTATSTRSSPNIVPPLFFRARADRCPLLLGRRGSSGRARNQARCHLIQDRATPLQVVGRIQRRHPGLTMAHHRHPIGEGNPEFVSQRGLAVGAFKIFEEIRCLLPHNLRSTGPFNE